MSARSLCAVLCLVVLNLATLRAQSSVAELNQAGWTMIQKGEPVRAAKYFADALAQQPDEPVLLFGAGVSAHLQNRAPDARSK
jgi:hypothetical protein